MPTNFKKFFLLLSGLSLLVSGCATITPEPVVYPEEAPESHFIVPEQYQDDDAEKITPQTIASLKLAEQARMLLESKRADEAIRILERAINIDPGNGQNYYFLSEAWLLKGNKIQAREFNRIAGIHLNNDPSWMSMIRQQKNRIMIGKPFISK